MSVLSNSTPIIHVKRTNQEEMEVCPLKSSIVSSDAWRGDKDLERVDFIMNINTILTGVFEDCTSLTTIKLCKSLKRIDANAFTGCTALCEVVVPDDLEEVDCWTDLRGVSKTIIKTPSSKELAENLKKGYAMVFYYKGETRPDVWD
jgi:hypothetical protein